MSKTCPSCLGKGFILTNAGTGLLKPCFNAQFHTLFGTSPKPRPRMGQNQDKQHNTAEPQTPATPAEGEGAIALLEKALSTPPPAVVPLDDVRPLVEALKLVSSTWTDKGLKDGETIRQVFHGEKTNVAHDALATFTAKHPL